MRNTIVIGTLLAVVGLAGMAQASDRSKTIDRDGISTTGEVSHDRRGDRHDRYERKNRTRERHDESHERSRERHNARGQHDRR
jgi:hypothetical protein